MVKNHRVKQREQRSLGYCWQWKANGQCSKGDNCSFRHETNKRAKSTQPNPSPGSSTKQSVKNASRTWSPRGQKPEWKNVSMAVQGLPSKELAPTPFCEKWHPPECVFYKSEKGCRSGESALMCTARLTNSPARSLKRMVTKCSGKIEEYTTIELRISRYGFAEVFIDFAEELKHTETNPMCSIH